MGCSRINDVSSISSLIDCPAVAGLLRRREGAKCRRQGPPFSLGSGEHGSGRIPLEETGHERKSAMDRQTQWESIKVEGGQLLDQFRRLLHEGNVRRIVISREGSPIVEFPLTLGVVGAALLPPLAAVGAIAALVTDCTIEVERDQPAEGEEKPADSSANSPIL
jgi:hypothetical protein